MKYKKKLIEVALPLAAINEASALEKQPFTRRHPRSIHIWWARRPQAAARAVIFAQMVDDPSEHPDLFKTKKAQDKERERLFQIIEDLVKWENTSNTAIIEAAKNEILQSWRYTCAEQASHIQASSLFVRSKLPAFHDPFAGGGALPLEAQRLGLESYATDLNPVPVLINKAMIEIPSIFCDQMAVNPVSQIAKNQMDKSWAGAQGLSEDIRYYGQWIEKEAEKRIGALYPAIDITEALTNNEPSLQKYIGKKLSIVGWLWARTVKSSNPSFTKIDVPLASTFILSTKTGKEVYVEPIINSNDYTFRVRYGVSSTPEDTKSGTKLARGANFKCLMSGSPMTSEYIKNEFKANRSSIKLMAIVVEGDRERIYLSPTKEQEEVAKAVISDWRPDLVISGSSQYLGVKPYGMDRFDQLFTERQLKALSTFSDLTLEVQKIILDDAIKSGIKKDEKKLADGGSGAFAYAEAVATYLAIATSRWSDLSNSLCSWNNTNQNVRALFARQAIPMNWDFVELSPFSKMGSWYSAVLSATESFSSLAPYVPGYAQQADAANQNISANKIISTDPPYYDNIPYADLSDFFYIWLRRSLKNTYPELFSTLATPKFNELVAFAYRHENGKTGAEQFFLDGMTLAMKKLSEQAHPAFPITIYYAFKQSESSEEGTTNTGWDTFLAAVIDAGFTVTGTWPIRTEREARTRGVGSNALASSIVLVCRKQDKNVQTASRREFISQLKSELPIALQHLQAGNIAPVDLAQAAIGPGMSVFTRFSSVLDADGRSLSVRAALAIINQVLDESLAEQEGDFDADSRWALTWFEQNGFNDSDYGMAEQLSKSKNTSIGGLVDGGILASRAGKVRLLRPSEMSPSWNPKEDKRLTSWEIVHQLIRALDTGGEEAAAKLVRGLRGEQSESARELCYRLYTLCERKKRPSDAMAYNSLVQSWPEIIRLSQDEALVSPGENQKLFE